MLKYGLYDWHGLRCLLLLLDGHGYGILSLRCLLLLDGLGLVLHDLDDLWEMVQIELGEVGCFSEQIASFLSRSKVLTASKGDVISQSQESGDFSGIHLAKGDAEDKRYTICVGRNNRKGISGLFAPTC